MPINQAHNMKQLKGLEYLLFIAVWIHAIWMTNKCVHFQTINMYSGVPLDFTYVLFILSIEFYY